MCDLTIDFVRRGSRIELNICFQSGQQQYDRQRNTASTARFTNPATADRCRKCLSQCISCNYHEKKNHNHFPCFEDHQKKYFLLILSQNDIYGQANAHSAEKRVLWKYVKAILPGLILLTSYGTQMMWGLNLMPYNITEEYYNGTSFIKALMILTYYLGGIVGIFIGAALVETMYKQTIYVRMTRISRI